ncbi:MAG TPA: HAD-IA family hydrolase [Dehalococcoidia bacterium]|nr:HAD-IA family hydrolase [Dehalococcoidia bacterium]
MIKVVFFDFYNTLVQFWPPLDQIQQAACREFGLSVSEKGIKQGYTIADVYFNRENEIHPLALRSEEERLEFFTRYEQMILENAGLLVSLDLARRVWEMAGSVPKDFMPFDDSIPALSKLQAEGYRLGLISNLRRDIVQLCQRLGMAKYLDYFINSAEVGVEKPNPEIFLAALEQAAVTPEEAVHVGDQHRSDVLGARAVGIHPVLIDRGGWHPDVKDCAKIFSLTELPAILGNAPHSLKSFHYKVQQPLDD